MTEKDRPKNGPDVGEVVTAICYSEQLNSERLLQHLAIAEGTAPVIAALRDLIFEPRDLAEIIGFLDPKVLRGIIEAPDYSPLGLEQIFEQLNKQKD